jgi:CBS domain-containing protein
MSSPLITIDQNAALDEASRIMAAKKIKRLPVVNDDRLVGLLSSTDIVRASPTQLGILDELMRVS